MEKYQRSSKETPDGKRYACPCCGYLTLDQEQPGTYDICPVCFWEDDPIQFDDPTYSGGANHLSLEDARRAYKALGATEERFLPFVRPPTLDEIPPSLKQ